MTTVKFANYLNSERRYESLEAFKCEEGFGFTCSYKIKQRQIETV